MTCGRTCRGRSSTDERLDQAGVHESKVLTVSMTCDHRILYGADAAAFLARLRELLGTPGEWAR